MAALPTTLARQIDARVAKTEHAFQFAAVDDRGVTPVTINLWSVVHFLLCIALLIWPVISLLRDGLPHSLPILVGCIGAALSTIRTPTWSEHYLSFSLVALGLVLAVLGAIQLP
jgi:hypothetical protein